MENTELLALPYILPSQAQKHITHNEAVRMLDALVQFDVKSRTVVDPPVSPSAGDRYAVPVGATGAWSGHDGEITAFQDGAWAYMTPREGWTAWCEEESALLVHASSTWTELISPDGIDNLPLLGVNATADSANRLAVASPASLFNHEGGSHRLKVNRASTSDTATLLFQTAFSGDAEIGMIGDRLAVKVAPDGSAWTDAMTVDAATGAVHFPETATITDVASTRFTDQFETNSTSFVPVSGFSVTVTPKSTTSRFLILVAISGYHKDSFSGLVRLKRNATEILSGVAASLSGATVAFMDIGSAQNWTIRTAVNFGVDAPATTAPVTYAIEVRTGNSTEPIYINRNHQTTYTTSYLAIPASNITVLEICK